jgi:hypothetical protein
MSITKDILAAKNEANEEKLKGETKMVLKIDPEFEGLLDAQTELSYEELKKLIEKDGIENPITVWKEEAIILDGHNRYKIAGELGIKEPPTQEKSFPDRAAAKEWIIRNQLGRRNLTPARFEYYIGQLYNAAKTEAVEKAAEVKPTIVTNPVAVGQVTAKVADKISKEFDITPQKVKALGTQAKGADVIAKIKGKFEKDKQLSSKPTYTPGEVTAIAGGSNTTVQAKTIQKIDTYKKEAEVKKKEAKKTQAAVAAKQTYYNVVLAAPEFDASGFSVSTEAKPTLDKDAIVYMIVPDEHLSAGVKLIERWGLQYEASLIFFQAKNTYDAAFTKVCHQFVLLGTKGHVLGPKAGQEPMSCTPLNGEIGPVLNKIVTDSHAGAVKKLDMRRGIPATNQLAGWEYLTK